MKGGMVQNVIRQMDDHQTQVERTANRTALLGSIYNTAARRNPESRFATRALGSLTDLGIAQDLSLGMAPPRATNISTAGVRPLDELLDGRLRSLLRISGRFI